MAPTAAAGSATPAADETHPSVSRHARVSRWHVPAANTRVAANPRVDSTPGEHRLLEARDRIVATFEGEPAELHQHGARRRVDQVVAERYLHDRSIALRDRDEPRGVVTAQLVQPDAV